MRKRVQIEVVHGEVDNDGGTVVVKVDGKAFAFASAQGRRSDAVRSARKLFEAMGRPKAVHLVLPDTRRKAA